LGKSRTECKVHGNTERPGEGKAVQGRKRGKGERISKRRGIPTHKLYKGRAKEGEGGGSDRGRENVDRGKREIPIGGANVIKGTTKNQILEKPEGKNHRKHISRKEIVSGKTGALRRA